MLEDQLNEIDHIDSVTTVAVKQSVNECIEERLRNFFPNWKKLIVRSSTDFIPILYNQIENLSLDDDRFLYRWTTMANVYFPNVKYVQIQSISKFTVPVIFKVIKHFPNSNISIVYSITDSRGHPLCQTLLKIDWMKILQNYQIINETNVFQLIRKPHYSPTESILPSEGTNQLMHSSLFQTK